MSIGVDQGQCKPQLFSTKQYCYCTEHLTASMVSTWYSVKARQVVQAVKITSLLNMGLKMLYLGHSLQGVFP